MAAATPPLLTCPGKLGDLLYALPLARGLAGLLGTRPHLLTSPACRAAVPLLAGLPYLAGVAVDDDYRPEHDRLGVQPWRMAEPAGFAPIWHLGLRPELNRDGLFSRHLAETHALNFRRAHGFAPELNLDAPWLRAEALARGPHLLLHPYGESLARVADPRLMPLCLAYWRELIRLGGRPARLVLGPAEEPPPGLDLPVVRPRDLLELAGLIGGAAAFLGVESGPLAVAEGLKAPRLALDFFGNALPRGPRGASFRLDEPVATAAARLADLLAGGGG